ncbi:HNH endonuclease [Mariniblastus fucicola]|uniref:HTH HARE-type domain-containing protein n=1 Tax=Mariniblastus fucicola TaxID=980251 RepID=A0A5B9PKD4_9BACT|nr:HNH endonuclease [Mariniblastus fucicola]QEG25156.1 hypothetical protein MFFC18_50800 [Mariniblastus fucicola]
MTIHEAAHKALLELGTPTHVNPLCQYIVDKGYYDFGAKNPANALAIQLSRRSINVYIGKSNPDKVFYRSAPATYGLSSWLEADASDPRREMSKELDLVSILRSDSPQTEKEQLVLARIGQGKFRDQVLRLWEHQCAVTGAAFTLRASHIKPWRESDDQERLNPNNGLPLCANLDSLFDQFLITFDSDGCIAVSNRLSSDEQLKLGIDRGMRLRKKPWAELEEFLAFHQGEFQSLESDEQTPEDS